MTTAAPTEPRIIAEISDTEGLRHLLRNRAEELNLSRSTLDEVAGLPMGYCAKLLCDPPMRDIGPISLWPLLGALGLAFAAVEDERAMVRVRKAAKRKFSRDWTTHWRNAKALGMIQKEAKLNGSKGGKKRFAMMTAAELREHQRRASLARWRAVRRARRQTKAGRGADKAQAAVPPVLP